MSKNSKKRNNIIIPLILLVFIFFFLYQGQYLGCITKEFSQCVFSKKYTSADGTFSFRYPNDYPMTFRTGTQMLEEYGFKDKYLEWVNFSNEFYPNAGGDRLGDVIVSKNNLYNNVEELGNRILSEDNNLPEKFTRAPRDVQYLTIGGKKAVRITTAQHQSSFDSPNDEYVVIHNGNSYSIDFTYNDYYHKQPVHYYEKGKQLILSTFKFN